MSVLCTVREQNCKIEFLLSNLVTRYLFYVVKFTRYSSWWPMATLGRSNRFRTGTPSEVGSYECWIIQQLWAKSW